jgi:IclR family KDG regulon transcriptional repressor
MEYHHPTVRVLRILELIDANPTGISLHQISQTLELPKGTISPILKTLAACGYICRENGTYSIGPKSFELGLGFAVNNDVLALIRKEMRNVAVTVGELCQMGVLSGLDVRYLLKETSNAPISVISEVGSKIPAHLTGLGKALLTGKTDEELKALYADHPLESYTEHSITEFDVLMEQIREARCTGLAYEKEESRKDVNCLAVPLILDGQVCAALSIAVPKYRYTPEKREQMADALRQAKRRIEESSRIQNLHLTI